MSNNVDEAKKEFHAKSGVRPLGRGYMAGEGVIAENAALAAYVAELSKIPAMSPPVSPDAGRVAIDAYIAEAAAYAKAHRDASMNYAAALDKIKDAGRVAKFESLHKSLGL